MSEPWERIEAEARVAFHGEGRFPLRAYSEAMPPPYVGIKPYAPARGGACTFGASDASRLDIDEYEHAHDLEPGLDRIGDHLIAELGKLVRGEPHGLSKTLLDGNPAWPKELADAAHNGKLVHDPLIVICPLALSRTQDDKGNERWTLFGASHEGAGRPILRGLTEDGLAALIAWAELRGEWKIFAAAAELGETLRGHRLTATTSLAHVQTLVTFEPFSHLPKPVRDAYISGALTIVPSPASLVFFEHPHYRKLAAHLPHAMQIPLLHLFPRIEQGCAIRIPQSGWLDEDDPATQTTHGKHAHKVVSHIARTHRWQRIARDADVHGDGAYTDKVSVALFSTDPVAIDLYDKPLARNAQIWNEQYKLVLDGQRADRQGLERAAAIVDAGGRFGYRMYYPPMQAGIRALYWHVPLVAASGRGRYRAAPRGYVTAELDGAPNLILVPHVLARPGHVAAAQLFERDPGHARHTTSHNIRKLLETRELLGEPLAPDHARAMIHIAKDQTLAQWLAQFAREVHRRACGGEAS